MIVVIVVIAAVVETMTLYVDVEKYNQRAPFLGLDLYFWFVMLIYSYY